MLYLPGGVPLPLRERDLHGVIGTQAQYARIPLADGTLVTTPDVPSEDLIPSLLTASDVLGTGWFAAVAAEAGSGKTVAVVGDGAGLLGVAVAAEAAPVALLSLLTVPVGLGAALAIPIVTALLVNSVPAEHAGIASGVLNTCRQIGGALAVAVFGTLITHRDTFVDGMRTSLLIAALLLATTAVVTGLLRPTQRHASA